MILDYLKEHTKNIHQELEKDNLAKLIMDHSISKETYQKLLTQNYYFYQAIEQSLIQKRQLINASLHPFLTNEKSQRLKKDLNYFGCEIERHLPQKKSFKIDSENTALGALYVSEGSALGGLMISKQLKNCPHLSFMKEHCFFGTDVSKILGRWKNFKETVTQNFQDESIKDEVLKSATKTFEFFGEIMREGYSLD